VDDDRNAVTDNTEYLVKMAQAGRRSAFDQLVRLYQGPAMRVAVGILGSTDEALGAVQEAFVTAYLRLGKLRETKKFRIWFLRIVANEAVDKLRNLDKIKRKRATLDDRCGTGLDPSEIQQFEELRAAVQAAMLQLSKKQAKAISLFALNDLSHREVAEIMGCSVAAARWYVFKARQKLRHLLREYLE